MVRSWNRFRRWPPSCHLRPPPRMARPESRGDPSPRCAMPSTPAASRSGSASGSRRPAPRRSASRASRRRRPAPAACAGSAVLPPEGVRCSRIWRGVLSARSSPRTTSLMPCAASSPPRRADTPTGRRRASTRCRHRLRTGAGAVRAGRRSCQGYRAVGAGDEPVRIRIAPAAPLGHRGRFRDRPAAAWRLACAASARSMSLRVQAQDRPSRRRQATLERGLVRSAPRASCHNGSSSGTRPQAASCPG